MACSAMAAVETVLYAMPQAVGLAGRIGKHLGLGVRPMEVRKFACGESCVDVKDSVRGKRVVLVSAAGYNIDEIVQQTLIAIHTFRLASAAHVVLIWPNLPYSRQDRKDASRQPITARLLADQIGTAGANRLITMDLHASQIQGFYDPRQCRVDNLYGSFALIKAVVAKLDPAQPIAVVSPDAGGRKRVETTAAWLRANGFPDVEIIFMSKKRGPDGKVVEQTIIGDPGGRNCILVDDMGDSCGTLMGAAAGLRSVGVLGVVAAVTHGVFSKGAVTKLVSCDDLDRVYVTDTCIDDPTVLVTAEGEGSYDATLDGSRIEVVGVAGIFAGAIVAAMTNGSVSKLFA